MGASLAGKQRAHKWKKPPKSGCSQDWLPHKSVHTSERCTQECVRHGSSSWAVYSASTLWTNWTAIEPSPTAEATRLTLSARISPTAKSPGRLVSSM